MSIGCFSWQLEYGYGPLKGLLQDILQKGLLSGGDPRMLLLQWGWGSPGFCSVFSDSFFVVTYPYLSLTLTIDFCYSQLTFFCILFKKDKNK